MGELFLQPSKVLHIILVQPTLHMDTLQYAGVNLLRMRLLICRIRASILLTTVFLFLI